jgi:D-arabinose 1-dehydrogenase-like Zn-dependent alcohol dehydrogenase
MPHMTAMVLTAEHRLALERRPVPTPRADHLLVDVDPRGICGSDQVASISFSKTAMALRVR